MKKTFIIVALIFSFIFLIEASFTGAAVFDLPNIPCPSGTICPSVTNEQVASNPAAYIARLYQIALAIAGVLAVAIIVTGSLFYTFAGGSSDRQNEGKEMITAALWGMLLLFGSYLVLRTVNPEIILSFGVIGGPEKVASRSVSPYSIAEDRLRDVRIPGEAAPAFLTPEELKKASPANLEACTKLSPVPPPEQLRACVIRSNCIGCVALDPSILVKEKQCQWGSEGSNCIVNPKTNIALIKFISSLSGQGVAYRVTEAFPPTTYHVSTGHYNGCSLDVSVWSSGTKSLCEAVALSIDKAKTAGFNVYNEYGKCGGTALAHATGNHLHLTTQGCP